MKIVLDGALIELYIYIYSPVTKGNINNYRS